MAASPAPPKLKVLPKNTAQRNAPGAASTTPGLATPKDEREGSMTDAIEPIHEALSRIPPSGERRFEVSSDEFADLYARACNVVHRAQMAERGVVVDDDFSHTSNGARPVAIVLFEQLGIVEKRSQPLPKPGPSRREYLGLRWLEQRRAEENSIQE